MLLDHCGAWVSKFHQTITLACPRSRFLKISIMNHNSVIILHIWVHFENNRAHSSSESLGLDLVCRRAQKWCCQSKIQTTRTRDLPTETGMAASIALKDESWSSEQTEQCEEEHAQEPRGQSDGAAEILSADERKFHKANHHCQWRVRTHPSISWLCDPHSEAPSALHWQVSYEPWGVDLSCSQRTPRTGALCLLWSHSGLHIISFRVCFLGTSMFCCLPTGLLVLSSGGLVGLSQLWTGAVLLSRPFA